MKLSKTDYRGSPALRLATRSFELIAPTAYGPRILSLRSLKAGGSLMYEYPPDDGGAAGGTATAPRRPAQGSGGGGLGAFQRGTLTGRDLDAPTPEGSEGA